ncbi:MAG: ABC transporter substrate binding protein [Bradyrhizobium sp.]
MYDSGRKAACFIVRPLFLIDRILRGARPSELPVETPTKFELVIDLEAAKALGLTIPESIARRALWPCGCPAPFAKIFGFDV